MDPYLVISFSRFPVIGQFHTISYKINLAVVSLELFTTISASTTSPTASFFW